MARYITVPDIIFTDINGKEYMVKDVRPIADEPTAIEIDVQEGDLMDEVASRQEVYGEFGEAQSYRIFDQNIVELTENNFNIGRLKRLRIPL